jgi:hypothetical protein
MPELHHHYAYFICLTVMLASTPSIAWKAADTCHCSLYLRRRHRF